jgi:hypothetical protein
MNHKKCPYVYDGALETLALPVPQLGASIPAILQKRMDGNSNFVP